MLTDEKISQVINEALTRCLEAKKKGLLLEMPYPRKVYKDKVDDKLPQVLTNWCLVHYCTLTDRQRLKKHWQGEVRGHLLTVSNLGMVGNDKPDKRLKVLNEIWEERDLNLVRSMSMTVCNKFIEEKIDIRSDAYEQTIKDCIGSVEEIFKVILSRDIEMIRNYVLTI